MDKEKLKLLIAEALDRDLNHSIRNDSGDFTITISLLGGIPTVALKQIETKFGVLCKSKVIDIT